MFLSLNQLQTKIQKQPLKLTDSLEKEYNLLIEKINQKEKKAVKRGVIIPNPEILNREGGDATLVNNPYLASVHFGNYLAVREIIKSLVLKRANLFKLRILGIGEGSGVFAYFLASELKPKIYLATDYQKWLVNYGQAVFSGGLLRFSQLDATKMDSIPNNSFDVIIACEFIEHISPESLLIFLQECQRVLKDNGVVITTTPNRSCHPGKKFSGYPSHFTEFTAQELHSFIEKNLQGMYVSHLIFHLFNEKMCQEKQKRFIFEQATNYLSRGFLKLFPEAFLNKLLGFLYKKGRQKLSFPKEYGRTKLVYKPEDETKAFGLCLVLQT